jgi:hypothetical protein
LAAHRCLQEGQGRQLHKVLLKICRGLVLKLTGSKRALQLEMTVNHPIVEFGR